MKVATFIESGKMTVTEASHFDMYDLHPFIDVAFEAIIPSLKKYLILTIHLNNEKINKNEVNNEIHNT